MKVNRVTKRTVINSTQANSPFNVTADGDSKYTTVGKDPWRYLMDTSLFEKNCIMEGFNLQPRSVYGLYVKVRIGLVTNNQNDCGSCSSCTGFGISVSSCKGLDITSTSCGTTEVGWLSWRTL